MTGIRSIETRFVALGLIAVSYAHIVGAAGVNADFNGDGFTDLAIGVAFEDIESAGIIDSGVVNVLYGSAQGLTAAGDQLWHQDVDGVKGVAESGDGFGSTIAAGDFDGDGFGDLAIGVIREGIESAGVINAGLVNVLYGSAQGLTAIGDQIWHQDIEDVEGVAENLDGFGGRLATGDFDDDGFADLAISVFGEDIESAGAPDAGAVNVLYGSAQGLTAAGNQIWHQDSDGIKGVAEIDDGFGVGLATGDFDGDGFSDLAIGVSNENVAPTGIWHGAAHVLYGSDEGLTAAGNQLWHQDVRGVKGQAEGGDGFGASLAAGDFDGDGFADLGIGVAGESIESIGAAGMVNVLYGSAQGLTAAGDQIWHQDKDGVEGVAEPEDVFGHAVAAADFDGDGFADLAVGVPNESVEAVGAEYAGAINVLYGSVQGLTAAGDQIWHQDTEGVKGMAESEDFLGMLVAIAIGDFNGDGFADLAAGAIGEDIELTGAIDAGAVNVLYGSAQGLTAVGDQIWHQDSEGVKGVAENDDHFGGSLAGSN